MSSARSDPAIAHGSEFTLAGIDQTMRMALIKRDLSFGNGPPHGDRTTFPSKEERSMAVTKPLSL